MPRDIQDVIASSRAKSLVNYARQTDIPFGDTRAVLALCAVTAATLMYYGALIGA